MSAAADILIAAALIWQFLRLKTRFARTKSVVYRLIIGAILGIVLAIPLALVAAIVLGLIAGASEGAVETVANMLKQAQTAIQNLINFGLGLLEGGPKRD